ncbi:hypothetical protein Smar_0359 [Staphylothermus marinus F1]|uniref:Uncharacterized protein n=1 Tax=Staphylothermus marinus (strain ATCC 43588 / DSM 3639 / JCM 9404 / F1) TaxID=399550 RepID=A3DLG1_STAMF|nr:hypothetical protein [Staphylothermus marinus]ABN69471.1 hypothetical protein Smar_0359 [Staphylothermus marinus F1]
MAEHRRITIIVKGKNTYDKWTLTQWIYEIKDILEEEYNIEISVQEETTNDEYPIIAVEGIDVYEGLPGEEGYLIEILKKVLDEILQRKTKQDMEI